MRNGQRKIAGAALIAALALGVWDPPSATAQPKGPEAPKGPPPAPVRVAPVERRDVPVVLRAVGNVEASATVEIKAQVAGKVLEVNFREGQWVRRGDVLFRIDPALYEARVNEIQAGMERDRVEARNARRQAERYANLRQSGAVTELEYDRYITEAQALEAAVAAQEAALATARLSLDYCTIVAPIEGRAGEILVDAGNIVRANEGDPMVVVYQTHPVEISFSVPEQYLPDIRPDSTRSPLTVTVTGAGFDDRPQPGTVTFVDSQVDRTAGTIRLKAASPNETDLLWPGQFVTVDLTLRTRTGALVLPQAAIQTGQQGQFAYVLGPDGTVESRALTVIDRMGREAVVDGPLEPGEQVVTDGHLRLVPGARAEIITDEQAAPPATAPTEAKRS